MPSGDFRCTICGVWSPMQPHFCAGIPTYPPTYAPTPLTAEEVRQIIREELARSREQQSEKP